MRGFAALLITALLAALVAVAIYAGLASWNQGSVPTAPLPDLPRPEVTIPPIPALPPLPEARPLEAAGERSTASGRAVVELSPPPSRSLGLGVVDGTLGTMLVWRRVEPPPGAGAASTRVELGPLPPGQHWLVLASDPVLAHYSYLARARLVVRPGETSDARLPGDVHVLTVIVDAGDGAEHRPEVLRRDDTRWMYRGQEPAVASEKQGEGRSYRFELGEGTYEVVLSGVANVPPRVVTVPGTDQITLPSGP